MKTCTNCNKEFSTWLRVDGKLRNLNGRKFCTDCSPFGLHNTRKDINKSKIPRKYHQYTEEQKRANIEGLKTRRIVRKKILVAMKGGVCQICGYYKCFGALSFHHRDPKQKLFTLDSRMMAAKPMKELTAEADKCDLLCLNCHMEVEEQIRLCPTGVEPV